MLRRDVQAGDFFAVGGIVFQRSIKGTTRDFGGKVGPCFKVIRQVLGSDFSAQANSDPEWMQIKGVCRKLSPCEAEELLWKQAEQATTGVHQ